MIIKVPKDISRFICLMREQRAVYKTNRAFAGYSLWLLLKSLSTTGSISNIESQLPEILKLTKLSRATFYRHLQYAIDLNLIKTKRSITTKIILTGYKTVINENFLSGKMINVFYDPKKNVLFSKILESIEFNEANEKMMYGLNSTLKRNPVINHAFKEQAKKCGFINLEFNQNNLLAMQINAFQNGGTEVNTNYLFIANPDLNRSLQSISEARKMDHKQGAYYLIKKLRSLQLIESISRTPIECNYKKDWIGEIRGKCKNRNRTFSDREKTSYWNLPNDLILRNPANPY